MPRRYSYRHKGLIKLFAILGALLGLAVCIWQIAGGAPNLLYLWAGITGQAGQVGFYILYVVGFVICVLALIMAMDSTAIPLHWALCFVFGILILVFGGGVWALLLLVVAGTIGIVDELS
jgi:hypothetical protein